MKVYVVQEGDESPDEMDGALLGVYTSLPSAIAAAERWTDECILANWAAEDRPKHMVWTHFEGLWQYVQTDKCTIDFVRVTEMEVEE